MNAPADPPLELHTASTPDGLLVIVSARRLLIPAHHHRAVELGIAAIAVAVGAALLLDGALIAAPGPLLVAAPLMYWLTHHETDTSVRHRVHFGPHQLRIDGPTGETRLPWIAIGRTEVGGTAIHPVVRVHVHDRPPITLPMQNEPLEHAQWMATTIASRGRTAREAHGATTDVPRTLGTLRSTS